MAKILDEIESYVSYLSSLFPEAVIERQNVPINPVANTFVVKLSRSDAEQVGEFNFLTRTISIIFIADDDLTIFETAEILRKDLQSKKRTIPLINSSINEVLRITSFGHSEPFEYEDEVHKGVIFILTSTSQERRYQEDSGQLIQEVNFRK